MIGNGFDLHHGIPSHLWRFKRFVEDEDRGLSRLIDRYLPIEDDWSDLEKALADLDVHLVIDDLEHFASPYGADDWSDAAHHDFQYEVSNVVENLSITLRKVFGRWIRLLPAVGEFAGVGRLRVVDPDGLFLNFNYTPTLQMSYGVVDQHILHIHGRSSQPDADLILGHARNLGGVASLNALVDITNVDTRLFEANQVLDQYFSATSKPARRLIAENQWFFEHLMCVQEVYVLGHSLSDVDTPYIRELLKARTVTNAKWTIACHDVDDYDRLPSRLTALGVKPTNIVTRAWIDL